jgi:hypothetical protein
MRFLAIGHHTVAYTAEAAEALLPAEMRTARALYRERVIREAYMDQSYSDAVLLLDAADLDTATEQLNRYPMVRAGLVQFRITPLVGLPAIADGAAVRRRGRGTPRGWRRWLRKPRRRG